MRLLNPKVSLQSCPANGLQFATVTGDDDTNAKQKGKWHSMRMMEWVILADDDN